MRTVSIRKALALALGLSLTVLMAASDADAGKKKKKKKKKDAKPAEVVVAQQAQAGPGRLAPSAAVLAAMDHLNAYDTEAAQKALEAAPETDAWVLTARGRVLEQESDYEAAVAELRRAADLDPGNPAPVLFLGDSYAYSDNRGSAVDAWAQAESRARGLLDATPEDPDALYYLGVSQQRQKRLADAAVALEQARSLRPDDPMILFQLGTTRFLQERFPTAFELLSQALEIDKHIAYAYYYRGLAGGKINGKKSYLYDDLDIFVRMAPDAPEAATARQILASF